MKFSQQARNRKQQRRRRRRHVRLRGEQLESRRLLATLTVDTTIDAIDNDPGDGVCQIDGGGCSLRAAVQEANALGSITPHRVNLPEGTFSLTIQGTDESQAATGDLNIRRSVEIVGSGAGLTVIDAGGIDRVFDVVLGNVLIQGLTVQGGLIDESEIAFEFFGGGIRNETNLTIRDSIVSGNDARVGAGIANYNGTLLIERSVISDNGSATTVRGGGLFNYGYYDTATAEVIETTISGNNSSTGGGAMNYALDGDANLTIRRSTISGNTATGNGGGISNLSIAALYPGMVSASTAVRNTTITGNTAGDSGGGLHSETNVGGSAVTDILNSTITLNVATARDGGGVISVDSSETSTEIRSTIVADNIAGRSGNNLFGQTVTGSFNLVGDAEGHELVNGVDNNLIGFDPMLGPLRDNGGPTLTHAPAVGSPAADQGTVTLALETDQRGSGFLRTVDNPTVTNASDGTDIGAVEIGQVAPTFDFGDAPDGIAAGGLPRLYPTLVASDGARHRLVPDGPFLGVTPPDSESDGATNPAASGDDLIGTDDEDSIAAFPIQLTPGQPIDSFSIRHDGGDSGALLSVWLDLNLDGDWDDAGEQLVADRAIPAGPSQTSLALQTLPQNATVGTSFIRTRVSTMSGLGPGGEAPDGEVEDFPATIGNAPIPTADLSLTHTINNSEPEVGDTVVFTITVSNDGPDAATDIEVTNLLPDELFFERATVSRGSYEFEETWFLDVLPAGSSEVLQIFASVELPDSTTHTAEITFVDQFDPDSTPGNGVSGEDDQATVSIGTCLSGGPLHVGRNRVAFQCATPGAFVGFVHGSVRGTKEFEQYNVTVDIEDAESVAVAIADANGIASALIELTQEDLDDAVGDFGDPLLVQAFEMFPRQRKSNTLLLNTEVLMLRASTIGPGATRLDEFVFPDLVEAISDRWQQLPLSHSQRQLIQKASISVTDLPGDALGRVIGRTILIDSDAAGNGWYIDPDPLDDEEFVRVGNSSQSLASVHESIGRIDLLTVMMHEFGHVLGLPDSSLPGRLMSTHLDVGVRRFLTPNSNPGNAYDVNADGRVSALDALIVINWLDRGDGTERENAWYRPDGTPDDYPYLDATSDFQVTSRDALVIINQIARGRLSGEGEQSEHQRELELDAALMVLMRDEDWLGDWS